MGIFDFLRSKKDKSIKKEATESTKSELFMSINKYSEYIVKFISMQSKGNYAPISAFEKPNGDIVGFLYFTGDDSSYSLSPEEGIIKMEERFEKQLANKEILSYSILYHSQFDNDGNHKIANSDEELKAISIAYNFENIQEGKIGLPYNFEGDKINFKKFNKLTIEENNAILNCKPIEGKDYFQDREEIIPPSFENEIGITIKKSNSQDLNNTWCGIFGFETFRSPNGSDILLTYFALAMTKEPTLKNNLSISEINFEDISFKTIIQNDKPITILPIAKTDYKLNFETKEIVEWENVNNLEAIISGKGRDTFGLWFFATDYAENKETYQTKKEIDLNLSGIAFVLDIHKEDNSNSEVKYSKDFTMYMPNNDLPNYACFDFIGELESFKESCVLEDKSVKGFLLKIRLIIKEEVKDFFTIDIFVNKENMRFSELKKGMKLTGMFQLQGEISK